MLKLISSPISLAFIFVCIIFLIGVTYYKYKDSKKIRLASRLQFDKNDINAQEIIKKLEEEEQTFAKRNSKDFFTRKAMELQQSGTNISLPLYFFVMFLCCIVVFITSLIITRSTFLSLIAMTLGYFLPDKVVQYRKEKNINSFNKELIKALRRMSAVIRSGGSGKQAIEDVTKSKVIPIYIKIEFQKALTDLEYGKSIEEAIFNIYERTGSKDARYLAIAIEIQRIYGGNLAQIFDSVSQAITERNLTESQVKATLAENKMTSYVLTAMPVVIFIGITLYSPGYFDPLYNTWYGKFVLMSCFGMIGIGFMILTKMSKIVK